MPRWLRSGAAIAWRLLAIVAAIAVTVYALAYLRVVVLPVIIALLLSTVLRPPTRWLTRHRFSDGAAAGDRDARRDRAAAPAPSRWPAPPIGRQFSDLADSVQDGVREAGDALAQPPFNLSEADIQEKIDEGVEQLSDSSSELTGGALHGAILVGEVLTGLIITLLLLFFFLKDGPGLWRWIVDTFGGRQRTAHGRARAPLLHGAVGLRARPRARRHRRRDDDRHGPRDPRRPARRRRSCC